MTWPFWAAYGLRLAVAALVLAALYAGARALRGVRLRSSAKRCVVVVETTMLSPQATIHLLRVGERYLLLGSGSSGVSMLAELEPRDVRSAIR
jgi:flagellar biogenesis protein FliO